MPDISQIGNYRRDTISDRDRAAINRTLPAEIDREKLWVQLEPVIRETRSPKEIVAVRAVTLSLRAFSVRIESLSAQFVDSNHEKVIAWLAHRRMGIEQNDIAFLYGVNIRRVNEAIKAIDYVVAHTKEIYSLQVETLKVMA